MTEERLVPSRPYAPLGSVNRWRDDTEYHPTVPAEIRQPEVERCGCEPLPAAPPVPNSSFRSLLLELGELHDLKNRDYGLAVDPYANVRASTDWGIPSWVGAMVRANDKVKRLQKYARDGVLANEGVEDSLKDLAVYTLIALDLWRQERG